MQWFRCYHDIIGDPKLDRCEHDIRWAWIAILKVASASPKRGKLYVGKGVPMSAADLRKQADLASDERAQEAIDTFRSLKMLAPWRDTLCITNWDVRQKLSDDSTPRVRRYRAKVAGQMPVQKRYSNGGVTPPDTDTDKERTNTLEGDFETAWKEYPKRRNPNKAGAFKAYSARRREGVPVPDLLNAVINYAAECKRENREQQYVLLASTFFGPSKRYEDYIAPVPFEDDALDDVMARMG